MTAFLTIFRRFPTTFRRFPKILENLSEGHTNGAEHFPKISDDTRRLPKNAEDFQWRPTMLVEASPYSTATFDCNVLVVEIILAGFRLQYSD